jgi:tetratricopeptide (TPR) repeat protein/transcriptional regulator with XRE-family HTH domain
MMRASFGGLLRGYRLAAGLTQEELAERAGLSVRAVSDMERDRTGRPYPRSVRLLIAALALDPKAAERLMTAATPPAADTGQAPQPAPRTGAAWQTEPRQLPAPIPTFVGRAAELHELDRLLETMIGAEGAEGSPLVIGAIRGTAGVGKTALALHWAHRVSGRFPDGQLYVNLRGFGPGGTPVAAAEVISDVLIAFQVPAQQIPASISAQEALYRSVLADRRVLIVADNARDADQVRPLLPAGPGCLVLVTSRSQLTSLIAGQGAHPVTLDVLADAEAGELLTGRLGAEHADPATVARLVGLCARLPLALAVVAARATTRPRQPLSTLADELVNERGRLDGLDGGDATTSVRAVLSWSYASLSVSGAGMFRLLGVHPGPDIDALAAASLAGVDRDTAHAALTELTRANLLSREHPNRFSFHDLLRTYAAEQARTADSALARRTAVHRVLDHYLHTARAATQALTSLPTTQVRLPPLAGVLPEAIATEEDGLAWYEANRHVLHAMVGTAVSAGFDEHAWQLPAVMATFLHRRGYWRQNAELQRAGLAAAERLGDLQTQARMRHGVGHAQGLLGAIDDAQREYVQALELYRQLGDRTAQAHILVNMGALLGAEGRWRESLTQCELALAIYTELGDRGWQARTLNNIGWGHAQLGDYRQCLLMAGQALDLHRQLGDKQGEATAWDSIGYAHYHLGDYGEALACYGRALQMFRDQGHRFNQADILTHLGDAHDAAGHPDAACAHWGEALDILDHLQHSAAEGVRARLRRSDRQLLSGSIPDPRSSGGLGTIAMGAKAKEVISQTPRMIRHLPRASARPARRRKHATGGGRRSGPECARSAGRRPSDGRVLAGPRRGGLRPDPPRPAR